jgi:hypothetical protein
VSGVIDCHVHLHPRWGDPFDCAEVLLRAADRVGVERMCLSLGVRRDFKNPRALDRLYLHNDDVQTVIERWPDRFIGFCFLMPNYLPQSLEEMERRIANGPFSAIKTLLDVFCDAPNYDPICERAAELGVPIQQHTWIKVTGNYPRESEPWRLARLARRHPETTFLAAHTGGNWERGIRQIADTPNVLADICGGDPEVGYVEMAIRWLGAERIVYGSDAPGRSFASQLAKVHGADVGDEEKQLILSGNMRRVLVL